MILYHVSHVGKLKKLSPRKPRHFTVKALYLAPTLKDAAYWQHRLSEEKKKDHIYIYEVEVNSAHTFFTDGKMYGSETIWQMGTKTWTRQIWIFESLKVKKVYRKKL